MSIPNSNKNPDKSGFSFPWFSSSSTNSISKPDIGFLPQYADNARDPEVDNQSPAIKLLSQLRERMRPWSEFFKTSKFGWPPSIVAVPPRVKKNIQYFMTNYLCLIVVLFIYCILTSFLMLLALIVMFGLFHTIYQRNLHGPTVIKGYEVPPSLMYTVAIIICFPLFFMADAGEVMYWVIGSSMFLALAHATFYASEEVPGAEFEVVTVVNT